MVFDAAQQVDHLRAVGIHGDAVARRNDGAFGRALHHLHSDMLQRFGDDVDAGLPAEVLGHRAADIEEIDD
jgi:hypothetical protein